MNNKKVLSKIDLGSFIKPNPYKKDIIYDPRGQWEHPGENTRIPGGDITMEGVDYPVWAQPSVGPGAMMQPGQDYNFPGAEYVDEYPQMRKGGSKKGKSKYTRNILATNRLLVVGDLFKKPKKSQIFDPNASFYQDGGQANDYIETELTDDEIQAYRDGGYVVEESNEYKKGGALLTKKVTCKKCSWTWDAADGGDDVTTCHKCGGQGLIHAQGGGDISIPSLNQMQDGDEVTPVTAPQRDQYIQNSQQQIGVIPTNPPVQEIVPIAPVIQPIVQEQPKVPTAPISVTNDPIPVDNSVIATQKKLKAAGYDLGKFGPNGDGIDGQMGNRTKLALDAFNAGIPPSKVKPVNPTEKVKGQTNNYRVNTALKDGYLPYISQGEETCVKGKGCSANVSIKMGNLLGNITDDSLWANDAWFNKSDILNKGGDFIYENKERDFSKMQKVPKDVWSKLQVGDYVQLNRTDTNSSAKFAGQTKEGLENEGIEHLGFIVGKDKDGTPLVWHGSETGKAYVQRIDQSLVLHDENKRTNSNTFTYQIASIVRSPSLKNADFSGLQNSAYYTPLDPKKKLVPKKGATESQVQAVTTLNNSTNAFKNLGYSQDDANYVGRILIGGIMGMETKGDTSQKAGLKQTAAYLVKDVAGIDAFDIPLIDKRFPGKEFEQDEASVGAYQIKPNLNFREKDGSLNPLGKKLQRLGIEVDDITSGNIEAQTKAGTLILLDNYEKLKKDPNFNVKTGLYKGKIPASYILAKSWQAGEGWYKRDKYKKFLDNFDIDYSNGALEKAVNTIDSPYASRSMTNEYAKVTQYQTQRQKEIEADKKKRTKEAALKAIAEKNKKEDAYRKANPNYAYERQVPTESTNVYNPYKESLKSFDLKDFAKKKGMGSTVYKYGSKPGIKYKKDANGKWYINSGKASGNKYVAIKDPSGNRAKTLEKGAKPFYAKEGGIVTSLTQDEINQYIKDGYIVEQLD